MTVKELLISMEKEAKKKGILDWEIWNESSVRHRNLILIPHRVELGKLVHAELGYKTGGDKPIKAICKIN